MTAQARELTVRLTRNIWAQHVLPRLNRQDLLMDWIQAVRKRGVKDNSKVLTIATRRLEVPFSKVWTARHRSVKQ